MINSVNKYGSVPIYQQIREMLVQDINSGNLRPHTKVPSEYELSRLYEVSRMTINKVMSELTREGLLYRRQGKGTFVSQKKMDQWFFRATSFKEDMIQRGLEPKTVVLEKKIVASSPEVIKKLEVKSSDKVIFVKRLRYANNEPIMLESRFLNYKYCIRILDEPLETESIHNLLIQKYDLPLTRATQYLEAVKINFEESRYFNIQPGEPGFLLSRVTFTSSRPITWVKYIYRGDRYRFVGEFTPTE
jgi:GntR family transcriptional regulator